MCHSNIKSKPLCMEGYPRRSGPRLTWLDVKPGAAGRSAGRVDSRDAVRSRVVRPHLLYHQTVPLTVGFNHMESVAPYLYITLPPCHWGGRERKKTHSHRWQTHQWNHPQENRYSSIHLTKMSSLVLGFADYHLKASWIFKRAGFRFKSISPDMEIFAFPAARSHWPLSLCQ